MTTLAAPVPTSANESIFCARCGYDLRSLPLDGQCPECASPIASSLTPNLLHFTDPSWTTIVAFSFSVMIWGAVLEIAQQALLIVFADSDESWLAWEIKVFLILSRQVFWIGLYLLAYPDPRPKSPTTLRFGRFCIRITAILGLMMTMVLLLSSSWFRSGWDLLANLLALLYMLHLAHRTGARSLLRQAWIAIFVVCVGRALAVFAIVAQDDQRFGKLLPKLYWLTLAALVYQVFVFYLFRRTLLKSAAVARKYWHFCSPIPTASESSRA